MTVDELMSRCSYAELVEWMAFDSIRNWEQEKAQRESQKGMRSRR